MCNERRDHSATFARRWNGGADLESWKRYFHAGRVQRGAAPIATATTMMVASERAGCVDAKRALEILVPVSLCAECSTRLPTQTCPICRAAATQLLTIRHP